LLKNAEPKRFVTEHDFSRAHEANQIDWALPLRDVSHADCTRLQAFSTNSWKKMSRRKSDRKPAPRPEIIFAKATNLAKPPLRLVHFLSAAISARRFSQFPAGIA
jgi:hypothetical protein